MTIDAPETPLFIRADRTRLSQVVANLLINAAKYTDEGGNISITLSAAGGFAEIKVRDDGVGIPSELLPRVFELFEQGARTVDRSGGGLGLGLAIVKSIVALHGGSVTAFSEGPGLGSEFLIRLPLPSERNAGPPSSERPAAPRTSLPKRVLVVDDNADAAELLAHMLRLVGHIVQVAENGPQALELASTFLPDVILLDIGLPVMDGYEVAARLRQLFPGKMPSLVAVTGYGQEADRERSKRQGFAYHLVKPVELSQLSDVIAAVSTAGA